MTFHPILLFKILIFLNIFFNPIDCDQYYVNSSYTPVCTTNCGGITNPFNNIKQALENLKEPSLDPFPIIIISSGTYKGINNKGLIVNRPMQLKSYDNQVIIDCENNGNGISIINSKQVIISGISVKSCYSQLGGGIYIENTLVTLSQSTISFNYGYKGAAIYSKKGTITLIDTVLSSNTALYDGSAIYSTDSSKIIVKGSSSFSKNYNTESISNDISCEENSNLQFSSSITTLNIAFTCNSGCESSGGTSNNHCQNARQALVNGTTLSQNRDITCKPQDQVSNLPTSCLDNTATTSSKCYFSGLILESKSCQSCKKSHLPLSSSYEVNKFMKGTNQIVSSYLYGFFKFQESKFHSFKFSGQNTALKISLDGKNIYTQLQLSTFNKSTNDIFISKGTHLVQFEISSDYESKNFQLFSDLDFFYSKNICGDDIKESNEICDQDSNSPKISFNMSPTCGDNICNENYDTCFKDCYEHLATKCSPRQVPSGHISPGFWVEEDTLGDLISNQMIWQLPGSHHLNFGIDIVNGEESKSQIFSLNYCEKVAKNIIEDPFRGMVYDIPSQLNVKLLPVCSFSTTSTEFKSSSDVKSSMQQSTSMSFEASFNTNEWIVSGEASASYSQEKSVSEAQSISKSSSQKLIMTELDCTSSYVEMDVENINFNPRFLKELVSAKNSFQMLKIIKKYGTHFYKSTYLGGKLRQFTSISSYSMGTSSNSEQTESASASFSASVSSPPVSVSGSVEASLDRSMSTEKQQSMEDNTSRSKLITYGGEPGTFAPSDSIQPKTFSTWSSTIDQAPVPINYDLYPIRYLLNKNWKTSFNDTQTIYDLWTTAENIYYLENNLDYSTGNRYSLVLQYKDHIYHTILTESLMTISYTLNNKNEVFKFYPRWTHVDTNGASFPFADHKNPISNKTTWINIDYQFNSQRNTTYYDSGDTGSDDLTVVHFNGPDFMSSSTKPVISWGLMSNFKSMFILSWDSYESIILSDGVIINNSSQVFGSIMYEHSWAWHWLNNLTENVEFDYFNIGIFGYPVLSGSGNREYMSPTFFSSIIFQEYKYSDEYRSDWAYNWYQWRSFQFTPYSNITDMVSCKNINYYGSQNRIDWIMMHFNDPLLPLWKRKIYAYHVKDNPLKGAEQFIENNLNLAKKFEEDPYSDLGFYPLKPLSDPSYMKHHFSFPNYNFRRSGAMVKRDSTYNQISNQWKQFDSFNINSPDPHTTFIDEFGVEQSN